MAFQLSPGLNVNENDLTLGPRAVSTSKGAFVGRFAWGPVDQRTLVNSEDNLAARFAKPDDNNFQHWFSAANFLAYSNALEVVRVIDTAKNATTDGAGTVIKNGDHYDTVISADENAFIAKYPGALGNGLEISIGTDTNFSTWQYANSFDGAPNSANEVHIAVVDGAGNWSGVPGLILERFQFVSLVEGTRGADGSNIYYKDVINRQSQYVWVGGETFDFNTSATTETVTLATTDVYDEEVVNGVTGAGATVNIGAFDLLDTTKLYVSGSVSGVFTSNDYTVDAGNDTITLDADAGGEDITVRQLKTSITVTLATETFDGDDQVGVTLAGQALVEGDYTTTSPDTITIDPYNTQAVEDAIDLTATDYDAVVTIGAYLDYTLAGGQDDSANPSLQTGYDLFSNAEETDISLVITGPATQVEAAYALSTLGEGRKDVVVFISPEQADVVNNGANVLQDVLDFRDQFNSSSYGFMDCNWKYQYDKYNDKFRWVPLNGDIAGLAANTDNVADPWFSIAGYNRGLIRNAVKLAWNPNKAQRDELYKKGINPVITEAGEGTLLFGDKTMLSRPSAFDRINVRRLFIVLEKTIANAAKYQLFEFNDEFTRAQFVNLVEPFLRDVQGRRGIYDFRVVADESNNTPEVVDRNEFIGDIYIKPARSINYITLNFVAVRTGVSFEEVIG